MKFFVRPANFVAAGFQCSQAQSTQHTQSGTPLGLTGTFHATKPSVHHAAAYVVGAFILSFLGHAQSKN